MSIPNNIGIVDANTTTGDTKNYFNNFFTNPGTITANQNDALIGYFEQYTEGNKTAALAISSAIIYTSLAQGLDPMSILQQFTALPMGQIDSYIAMFLNLNRKGTSYLGINNQPIVNKYVKRSIIA